MSTVIDTTFRGRSDCVGATSKKKRERVKGFVVYLLSVRRHTCYVVNRGNEITGSSTKFVLRGHQY